jgi:hypothetical protein
LTAKIIKFPIRKERISKRGKVIRRCSEEISKMKNIDGFMIVAWDKKASYYISIDQGCGVINSTLLPSWIGDVVRRETLMPAAIYDMQEDDGA